MTDSRVSIYRALAAKCSALANAVENGTQQAVEVEANRSWVSVIAVATSLGITAQAANNRLTQLHRHGIVERRYVIVPTGGRAFEYRWTFDWNGGVP